MLRACLEQLGHDLCVPAHGRAVQRRLLIVEQGVRVARFGGNQGLDGSQTPLQASVVQGSLAAAFW